MRFRRRGHSLWEVRNYFNQSVSGGVLAGANTVNDNLIFAPTTYFSNPETGKVGKSWSLRFKSWMTDGIVTSAVVGTNAFVIYEAIYIADINNATASLWSAVPFIKQNMMGAVDVRQFPARVIWRRMVSPFPVFGTSISNSIGWVRGTATSR